MTGRPDTPLLRLDLIKFAVGTMLGIGLEAILGNVPVDVAFVCWLHAFAGALLWALIFGKRSIVP